MRRLIMWNVVTLNGCFEGEKPWDLSFHELVWGTELEALSLEQLNQADMLVFGKNTYKGMADYWTTADESQSKIGRLMNQIKKIVCSQTLKEAKWSNTSIVADAVSEISRIKKEGDGPIYIFGSANLSESLLNAGLLDEMRLCIAPVILGKGRRLFTEKVMKHNLRVLESRSLSNGGLLVMYEVGKS